MEHQQDQQQWASWSDELLNSKDQYAGTATRGIMGTNLVLSSLLVLVGLMRVHQRRTSFHWAVLIGAFMFWIHDLWFWLVVLSEWAPFTFEIVRAYGPIVCGSQVAMLSFWRFKLFSTTSLASWYTRPIWLTCITMTYLIAMFASLAVASTYWLADFSKPIPFSGVRKGAIVASSGLTLVADMTVTVLILRIVLTIRRALDREDLAIQEWRERGSGFESPQPRLPTDTAERQKRKRQYRKVLTRVGTALLVMVVMALVGLANYLMSNHVSGHMLSNIFIRIYVLAAMFEWVWVVDLVRDRALWHFTGTENAAADLATTAMSMTSDSSQHYACGRPHAAGAVAISMTEMVAAPELGKQGFIRPPPLSPQLKPARPLEAA